MTENVQLLVFSLMLIYSVYQSFCISPEPTRVPFKSAGDASLAFITGESGNQNVPKPVPTREYVGFIQPKSPQRHPGTTPIQSLSYSNQNPTSGNPGTTPKLQGAIQTSGRRDFLNTNPKPMQQHSSGHHHTGNQQLQGSPDSGRGGFVNSNYKANHQTHSGGQMTTKQLSTTPKSTTVLAPSGGRDFVNPNYKQNSVPSSNPVSLQSIIGPKDPFPTLKPNPMPAEVKPRDPFPALSPKNPFPHLPGSFSNPVNFGPVISYAGIASGGTTTNKPAAIPKPSTGGRRGSGDSTKPSEEETGKAYPDGPQDNELREFSEQLLKKDVNNAFKFMKLNVQGKTTSGSKNDEAPQNLLEINQDAFKLPSIQKLMPFYNNYILDVSENEYVTPQERNEEEDFLDTIVSTPVMQHTRNFLIKNGKIGKDPKEFKDLLRTTWFSMYSRGHGKVGSSGFEHVFLAELKKQKNEVSGLHNWLYFHEAEQKKLVNYLGYMKKVDLGEKGAILKFHFTLNDVDKPVNSIFVGTSPELEMALYTTCYVFRPNRVCPLRLSGHNFIVRAYSLKYRGKQLLGSAFPEI